MVLMAVQLAARQLAWRPSTERRMFPFFARFKLRTAELASATKRSQRLELWLPAWTSLRSFPQLEEE